jgi:hypothetical protein
MDAEINAILGPFADVFGSNAVNPFADLSDMGLALTNLFSLGAL